MGLGDNYPWVGSHMWPQQTWGQRSSRGQWPLFQVFEKGSLYPHTLMYFRGTWTQWSLGRITRDLTRLGVKGHRGSMTFGSSFWKKGQCIHILCCIFNNNITMIAKVCDPESRRDSCFENRLVYIYFSERPWKMLRSGHILLVFIPTFFVI